MLIDKLYYNVRRPRIYWVTGILYLSIVAAVLLATKGKADTPCTLSQYRVPDKKGGADIVKVERCPGVTTYTMTQTFTDCGEGCKQIVTTRLEQRQ